jgi:hypothetical protein
MEYYFMTHDFDVWSHTLMLELRVPIARRLEVFGDAEQWLRIAPSSGPGVVLLNPDNFQAPGHRLEAFFRAGFRFYPWEGHRHRASFSVTNKQIEAQTNVTDPIEVRFRPNDLLWLLTLEAFL